MRQFKTVCLSLSILIGLSCPRPSQADDTVCSTSALRPVGDVVIIDGLRGFSILIPKKATAQERYSANLLADYLERIFKVRLPVVQEPQPVKGKVISVGDTAKALAARISPDPREQAYKLAVASGNLYVLGGKRGPVYGAIALLEEDLGCRWYAANAKPVVPTISIDKLSVVPRSYSPPFEMREPLYSDAFLAPWAGFNRLQPVSYWGSIPSEAGGGLANPAYFIHTYDQLVPADKYFAKHPEYFPLREGHRHRSSPTDGQLCYTNPDVAKVIAETLEAEIAKKPGARIYSVSANDNVYDNCECPSCQKIIKVDGLSGAQLYLANEVANKLAVKHPDIKITTLAYVGSQKPPKTVKPGPNTVIFYAPIRQRGNFPMLPIGDIKEIVEELAGWHRIASNIYLWDYVDCYEGAAVPYPNFDMLEGGWQFLLANGVSGVFLEADFDGHDSLGELKGWLYAKKLWNPQWKQDALIKEFIASYYGPAASEMAEYVSCQRQVWNNYYHHRKPGDSLRFDDKSIEQMTKLLDKAETRCGGQADYCSRVERERLTLLSLSLAKHPRRAATASYAARLKEAEALIAKLKVKRFAGITAETAIEQWREKLKSGTEGNGLPQYSKNSVTVKKAACPVAQYLPDASATLGYAARQIGGGSADWGVQWGYGNFLDLLDQGKTYIVRMRARPEFKSSPQKPGTLFSVGCYTFGVGGGQCFSGKFSFNDDGKYRWTELFKLRIVNPGTSGYFYCVPGNLTRDEAVWYDYLEFVPEDEFQDSKVAAKLPLVKL
jgi:hypothetical protein